MQLHMVFTAADIIDSLGGQLIGSPDASISGIAPLQSATQAHISFLSHPKYQPQLRASQAGIIIVSPQIFDGLDASLVNSRAWILASDPYLYFALLTQWWRKQKPSSGMEGIHPSAVVDATARVHPTASIGPLCVIGADAQIGEGARLAARVTVGDACVVGKRCLIHSGVVIGADGFGFAPRADQSWEKIEQLGAVRIGDDVEIGANTCIDRGALEDTVIEEGVKIDNLVQIGHNVHIGKHTALAGNAGVAGSAKIGAYCTIGGGAVILGHLTIVDHVHVSASTTVMRSIQEPGHYSGVFPMDKNQQWEKNAASLRQLHSLRERIRELEKITENNGNMPP